jgi:hypothetical protein
MSDDRVQRIIFGCILAGCAGLGAMLTLVTSLMASKLAGG